MEGRWASDTMASKNRPTLRARVHTGSKAAVRPILWLKWPKKEVW